MCSVFIANIGWNSLYWWYNVTHNTRQTKIKFSLIWFILVSTWNICIHKHHWRLSCSQRGEINTVKVWFVQAGVNTCFRKSYILPSQCLFLCSNDGGPKVTSSDINMCKVLSAFYQMNHNSGVSLIKFNCYISGKKLLAVCLFWQKIRNHNDFLIIYNTSLIFVFCIIRFSLCYFCFDFYVYHWGKRKIRAYLLILWNTRVNEELR